MIARGSLDHQTEREEWRWEGTPSLWTPLGNSWLRSKCLFVWSSYAWLHRDVTVSSEKSMVSPIVTCRLINRRSRKAKRREKEKCNSIYSCVTHVMPLCVSLWASCCSFLSEEMRKIFLLDWMTFALLKCCLYSECSCKKIYLNAAAASHPHRKEACCKDTAAEVSIEKYIHLYWMHFNFTCWDLGENRDEEMQATGGRASPWQENLPGWIQSHLAGISLRCTK